MPILPNIQTRTHADSPSLLRSRSTSIEKNHESFDKLTRKNIGAGAAIKIEAVINQTKVQVGRHFEETDELFAKITRNSIDVMSACRVLPFGRLIELTPRLHFVTCRGALPKRVRPPFSFFSFPSRR